MFNLLWRGCDLRLNELKVIHILNDIENLSWDVEMLKNENQWLLSDIDRQGQENADLTDQLSR